MKEIYLLCNAHLDPVWLWQRREGMAEAISTFRVAAKFCEEYDGFVFNHNQPVYALAFFPSGNGGKKDASVLVTNDNIIMTGYKKLANGDIRVYLYNSTDEKAETELKIQNNTFSISFAPFEVKSFRISDEKFSECELTEY